MLYKNFALNQAGARSRSNSSCAGNRSFDHKVISSVAFKWKDAQEDDFLNAEPDAGQSVFGCALQIISTITGGGIVSVPYAMSAPGFETGILVNIVIIGFMMFCTHLYISSRDILGFDSISELSYMSFGRSSVFIINILVAFVIFGILLLYLILFSKISLSLVVPLIGEAPEDGDVHLI